MRVGVSHREGDRGGEGEKRKRRGRNRVIFFSWFTPKMPARVRVELGQSYSQEHVGSSQGWQRRTLARRWIGNTEEPGLKPVTPIWNVGIPSVGLICCATTSALGVKIFIHLAILCLLIMENLVNHIHGNY